MLKKSDSEKIKLKHLMEIPPIFWMNDMVQLLITPVGALHRRTFPFTGVERDGRKCRILCSSHLLSISVHIKSTPLTDHGLLTEGCTLHKITDNIFLLK